MVEALSTDEVHTDILSSVEFAFAAILVSTPLLILPGWFFYYDVTPKVIVALIGAAIGILLLLRDSRLREMRRLWTDPLGRWFCLLSTAQIVSLMLSTLFSNHPELSWNGGNWRRFGVVSQYAVIATGFLIAVSCSATGLRILLRAITVAGTFAAVYGICQYFGVDPILPWPSYHVGEGVLAIVRPPSTFGHADYFAGYLLFVVFFGAALVATETGTVWKTVGAAATTISSIAIVLSGTRGALLGLAAGAVSLWIWKRPRFELRSAVGAAVLCIFSLAFYFSPAGLKLRARVQWALEDLHGGARILLWRDTLRMASQHLIAGFGPETFGMEFPPYQSIELAKAYPDFYHESPHNIFLDALVSEGAPGLALLTGFVALAWFAARRAAARGQRTAPYLASALLASLISGLFVCFTLAGALYFYATIALLVVRTPSEAPARQQTGFFIALRTLGVATVAIFLYLGIQLTVFDLALNQAKLHLDAGRIEKSIGAFATSQRWRPAGSSDDLYFSRALAVAARSGSNPTVVLMASQKAFTVALRAVQTSEERQNAWYNLAAFYATQNNGIGMEAALRRSVEASPHWFKSHWALAQMLFISGRRSEALAEAAQAADLDGGKDREIAKFLQSVHDYPVSRKPE